jgi:hypothetical protein
MGIEDGSRRREVPSRGKKVNEVNMYNVFGSHSFREAQFS